MQKHIKNYIEHFGEIGLCEVCKQSAIQDVHHITPRSQFGKNRKQEQDHISNLIGLCRHDHQRAHLQIEPYLRKEELQEIHNNNL